MMHRSLRDDLQESMERLALGEAANEGAFCGHCYAALDSTPRQHEPSRRCPVCGTPTTLVAAVDRVPDEVLSIYMAKRRREGLIVNLFAFLGLFLSLVISAALWFVLPGNLWRVLPFLVIAFGSYYLARLLGYNVGVPLGSSSGRKLRDARWLEFERRRGRSGGATILDTAPEERSSP